LFETGAGVAGVQGASYQHLLRLRRGLTGGASRFATGDFATGVCIVKNQLVAAAIVAAIVESIGTASAADAAEPNELAQIRSQLQSLIQRVDRLEQENTELKTQNSQLKTQTAQLANQGPDTKQTGAPKAADWPSRIAVKGDVRYRHQQSDDSRVEAQRDEQLLRARLSVEGKVTDSMVAGIGFATSSAPGNPRGANVQMDGEFSRKPLYVDLGYIDWTFAAGAHAIGGKMKMPFVRPGQSLLWDNDINPEGIALTYSRGTTFGSAWGFWIEENVQYGATANAVTDTTDTKMYGMQTGNRFEFGGSSLIVAATYYDLAAAQGRRPFFNGSSNGNSLTANGGLAYDFKVSSLLAEYNVKLGELPLQVWADAARNSDAELDTAWTLGAMFGKAANPGTWEAGLAWQSIDKDALFAQHIDSDFAGGVSDSEGWVLRAGYAPLKNWSLNATYLVAKANKDVGTEYDYDRLLLDFNAKF
jgi:hypothetical protein